MKIYRHTHTALFTPIYKVKPVFKSRTSNNNIEQVEVTDSLITDIPEHLQCVLTNTPQRNTGKDIQRIHS